MDFLIAAVLLAGPWEFTPPAAWTFTDCPCVVCKCDGCACGDKCDEPTPTKPGATPTKASSTSTPKVYETRYESRRVGRRIVTVAVRVPVQAVQTITAPVASPGCYTDPVTGRTVCPVRR